MAKKPFQEIHTDLAIIWGQTENLTIQESYDRLDAMGVEVTSINALQNRVWTRKKKNPVSANPETADEAALLAWMQGLLVAQVYQALEAKDGRTVRSSVKSLIDIIKAKKATGVPETKDDYTTVNELLKQVRGSVSA